MSFQPLDHKIKLFRAQQDRLERLHGCYMRVGYGNPHRPYLLGILNNTKNSKYAYGLQIVHLSEGKEKYGEEHHQAATLHGKLFTKKLVLEGAMNYTWNKYPCILVVNDPQKTENDPNKHLTYHQIGLSTSLYNYVPEILNYQAQVEVLHVQQEKTQENQAKTKLHADYQLNETMQLQADSTLHVSQHARPDATSMTKYMLGIKPTLNIAFQEFRIQAGANISYHPDQEGLANFNTHPAIRLSYLFHQALRPYIELNGAMQPNSWQTYAAQNPWLSTAADLRSSHKRFILSMGAHSDLADTLTGHTGFSISNYQNYPCFINHKTDLREFDIAYDSSANIIHGFLELTKVSFEAALTTRLHVAYFHYNLTELLKPWHKPQYILELCNTYNFHDKILVKNNLSWQGGRHAQTASLQPSTILSDIIDLGLGIEYLWNKRFSIFLDCENMLNKENAPYLHTPTHGVRVLAGIAYGW
jgi:hypothetical protein